MSVLAPNNHVSILCPHLYLRTLVTVPVRDLVMIILLLGMESVGSELEFACWQPTGFLSMTVRL